ncbi:MAG: penicillin-binding transpeptidase domain-containing protein, partial [Bacteroidota bacterium]
MSSPRDQIFARMYVVLTLLSLFPLVIVGKMVMIYVTDGAELRESGEQQATTYEAIPARRGRIVDHGGNILAVNTARYDLAVDPQVAGFAEVQQTFFDKLARIRNGSAGRYASRLKNRTSPRYAVLERGLTDAQKEKVEQWDIPGLILEPHFARRYNYGTTAAHVLGHVDRDMTGLAGIELEYDAYLRGVPGKRAAKKDRRGRVKAFVGGNVVEPKHGETIVLTIDLARQAILEEELMRGVQQYGAEWATALALDPRTGAILAMANVPTYDPNRTAAFSTSARRNRAITDRIEPGSTFKMVPAVAAVERGEVTLADSIETGQGWTVFSGRTMKDTHAYGNITFAEVIAKSSNVGIAKTAMHLEPGVFYQYARNLGFGITTGVDLPGEVAGVLKKPTQWSGTTQAWMSHGYEVDATPLQVLTAYAALANGGLLVQPYIVAERRNATGKTVWRARRDSIRRAFGRDTAEALLPAFESVTAEGGTADVVQVEGLRIAGKTGTAQVVINGSYRRDRHNGSFVGFFPAEDPQVVLMVMMSKPKGVGYGGVVAAPVFQKIAERWVSTFPQIANQMAPTTPLPDVDEAKVPDVQGQPGRIAAQRLRAAGYRVKADTDEMLRVAGGVSPEPGKAADFGDRVSMRLDGVIRESMPDLRGLSSRQAMFWLQSRGIEVEVKGRGVVQRQSVEAGAPLPTRAVLTC